MSLEEFYTKIRLYNVRWSGIFERREYRGERREERG
jgi:hypothetical protein